jgi:hypothetical protein
MTLLLGTKNKTTLALALAGLMGATSAVAGLQQTDVTTATPHIEQSQANQAMSFSFALQPQALLTINTEAVTSQSDEYWFTVTGEQLNAGVDVHTTVAGALIKISRQGKNSKVLDSTSLKLHSANKPHLNLAANVIKEDDLKATGVFANASAIKMDKAVKPGSFKLSYSGALAADNQFVVHVKEKHSTNKLTLSTQKQHYLQGEALSFDALMTSKNDTLAMQVVDAFILSPSGKKMMVPTKQLANGSTQVLAAQFAKNDAIEAPINGLHELHVNGMASINGQQVHRTAKIAFALAPQTASLQQNSAGKVNGQQTQFALNVVEAGRFEVRGILYGHDVNGQLKPIMETHSARNLSAGKQSISMAFDQKILAKSGLAAPYEVKHVRLYDQTRMSRLSM